jgi:hypothetical protein
VSIYLNKGRLVITDDHDPTLGTFLFLDIGYDPYKCLATLDRVGRIVHGRSKREVVGGDLVSAVLTPEYAELDDHFDASRSHHIAFADFKNAVEELWIVLYRANTDGDLARWENTFKQRHPYRGRIEGIPARGPE